MSAIVATQITNELLARKVRISLLVLAAGKNEGLEGEEGRREEGRGGEGREDFHLERGGDY